MELKLLADNEIWIRSFKDELVLVKCDKDGILRHIKTQLAATKK